METVKTDYNTKTVIIGDTRRWQLTVDRWPEKLKNPVRFSW